MNVPRLLVLTDRHASADAGRSLTATVARAVDAGAPAVLLREKDLPTAERGELATRLREVTATAGAALMVASDVGLARDCGADGVHLASHDPPVRGPGPTGRPAPSVGRSCHAATEVRAAASEGVDLVTVSPVARTSSKPGYGPALGVTGLGQLIAVANGLPVLALGGVTATNAERWFAAGASGVAVMGAVMGAPDPGAVVAGLLAHRPRPPETTTTSGALP